MPEARKPGFASQDWILEQQMRAELEAEAWKRLRHEMAAPPAPVALPPPANDAPAPTNYHRTGSTFLKAIVRFALAALGAYLAWIAAVDSQLGEVEVWFAVSAGFLVTLSLSLLSPFRGLVYFLAETARWVIVVAAVLGGLWFLLQGQG
jgi:hypothetical protein